MAWAAGAEEAAVKPEAPEASAEAKPDAEKTAEFKPPPGFRPRKRGENIVYCRKEAVLGSRFPSEKCYDRAGLRQLELYEHEQRELLERIRACNGNNCSAG